MSTNAMRYHKVVIPFSTHAVSEMVIALLSEEGYEGFEEAAGRLEAYIPSAQFPAEKTAALLGSFGLSFTVQEIPATNWNAEWEKHFTPVIIDDFCQIRASFHPPVPQVTHDILIHPKMSFGTGHHATTQLMVNAMRDLDFNGKSVLDFGTGTGLLAILAEKMGADAIKAIDVDDWSMVNALENSTLNGCRRIVLEKANQLSEQGMYDVLLANINKNVIIQHLPAMKQHLHPGGVMVLSGFLEGDIQEIMHVISSLELLENKLVTKDSWVALTCKMH